MLELINCESKFLEKKFYFRCKNIKEFLDNYDAEINDIDYLFSKMMWKNKVYFELNNLEVERIRNYQAFVTLCLSDDSGKLLVQDPCTGFPIVEKDRLSVTLTKKSEYIYKFRIVNLENHTLEKIMGECSNYNSIKNIYNKQLR